MTGVAPLHVRLGMDDRGDEVSVDLAVCGSLLVVGPTGSGKSVVARTIVDAILAVCSHEQVRLVLIDPSRLEFGPYAGVPHLLTAPVSEPHKVRLVLDWVLKEIDRRVARHLEGNANGDDASTLPIVVVFDGLEARIEAEDALRVIAQRGPRVGVVVVVTAYPAEGRSVLDTVGARTRLVLRMPVASDVREFAVTWLLGHTDERFAAQLVETLPLRNRLVKLDPIDEDAEWSLVKSLKMLAPAIEYSIEVDDGAPDNLLVPAADDEDEDEVLVRQAMELVVRSRLGSPSMLQRKLTIGFARAGRIMDLLEQRGVVGPPDGVRARSVLMSIEELDLLYGR